MKYIFKEETKKIISKNRNLYMILRKVEFIFFYIYRSLFILTPHVHLIKLIVYYIIV